MRNYKKIPGIGLATACKLKASFQLGEKALTKHKRYNQKIESPEDVYDLLKEELAEKKERTFQNSIFNIQESAHQH